MSSNFRNYKMNLIKKYKISNKNNNKKFKINNYSNKLFKISNK